MIQKGINVNALDDRGCPLLWRTINSERLEMFLLLLGGGADIEKIKLDPNLHYELGLPRRLDMCRLLLGTVPSPERIKKELQISLRDAVGRGNYDMVAMLLKAGADPNPKNGGPPLHSAARGRDTEMLKLLLRYGANVNAMNNDGETALAIAVKKWEGHKFNAITKAEILLTAGADVNLHKEQGPSYCFKTTFPLYLAVETCNTELVELLIKHGADVNKKIVVPNTVMSPCSLYVQTKSHASAIRRAENPVKIPPTILSPLSAAIKSGYLPMVKLLMKHGAKATEKQLAEIKKLKAPGKPETMDIFKCIYRGRGYEHGRYEEFKRIIAAGADINVLDNCRQSLLEKAASENGIDLLRLLLKHGAEYKGDALRHAVSSGCLDKVKLLLEYGADPNTISRRGLYGPAAIFYLRKNALSILPLLLKAGADINLLNYAGHNLLAANCNNFRDTMVFKALLKAGADWKRTDRNGISVVENIIRNNYDGRCVGEIKILLDLGADREKIRKAAKKYKRSNLFFLLDNVWKKKSIEEKP